MFGHCQDAPLNSLVHSRKEDFPRQVHLLLRQDGLLVPHVEILREGLFDRLAVVPLVQIKARWWREGGVRAVNLIFDFCVKFPFKRRSFLSHNVSSSPSPVLKFRSRSSTSSFGLAAAGRGLFDTDLCVFFFTVPPDPPPPMERTKVAQRITYFQQSCDCEPYSAPFCGVGMPIHFRFSSCLFTPLSTRILAYCRGNEQIKAIADLKPHLLFNILTLSEVLCHRW